MSFAGAIIAGLVATFVCYATTRLTTMNLMGMERILGAMFTKRENSSLGLVLLFAGGAILGLVYGALWSIGVGWPDYLYGSLFGAVQWLVLGVAVGFLPAVRGGIGSGAAPAPGFYMVRLLGSLAFVAGLVNHVIFGFVVAYVYQFFRSRYG